jgi:hypothetical protein
LEEFYDSLGNGGLAAIVYTFEDDKFSAHGSQIRNGRSTGPFSAWVP